MANLMTLIEDDRKANKITQETLAREAGIPIATYSRHKAGTQALSLSSVQAYASYAQKRKKVELLAALGAFALGLNVEDISIKSSN